MSKYKNQSMCVNGISFQSRKEAKRYIVLLDMQSKGFISDLRTQVKFELIPAQREFTNEIYTKGKNKGCLKQGKLLERECCYVADFVYFDKRLDETIVEDTKGVKTKDYIIKRKLMLREHGIRIKEV